jgi:SAM-dependent methyltransferase
MSAKSLVDEIGCRRYIRRLVTDRWSMPTGSGDGWAADYERARPGWPSKVVDVPGLAPTATVLDLGAGTGKLTRVLASTFDHVIAVEPADAMRRILETACPEAETLPGAAQSIPLADSSVDAVFAAQAFHTFDDEHAVAEIARVLRPGGVAVLMWNVPAGPWEPSAARAEAFLNERGPDEVSYIPLDLGGPRYTPGEWPLTEPTFEQLEEMRLPNPQRLDRDRLVTFYATMDWVADLPDGERLPLLERVRSLLPALEYQRLWETHVHWTRRAA